MSALKKFLSENFRFSEKEQEEITSYFQIKEFSKGDFFLKEGQYCRAIAFVETGTLMYVQNIDGEEKVCDFAFDGDWVAQYKSIISESPSELSIKFLGASKLHVISLEKMQALSVDLPQTNLIRSSLAEKYFTESAERATNLATLKAEDRYKKLLVKIPDIHNKVPQYYIASFLGIKPQSLSRIRAMK